MRSQDLDLFFGLASVRTFQVDEAIISEGDPGDGMFVASSGEVRVEKATLDKKQEVLAVFGPGQCFGEISLIDRKPRSATVRACGPTDVFLFGQSELDEFFEVHPDIHRKVLENLAKITSERLRLLDDTLVQSVYDVVILVDLTGAIVQWKRISDTRHPLGEEIDPSTVEGRDLFELIPHLGKGVLQKVMEAIDSYKVLSLQLDYESSSGRTS